MHEIWETPANEKEAPQVLKAKGYQGYPKIRVSCQGSIRPFENSSPRGTAHWHQVPGANCCHYEGDNNRFGNQNRSWLKFLYFTEERHIQNKKVEPPQQEPIHRL